MLVVCGHSIIKTNPPASQIYAIYFCRPPISKLMGDIQPFTFKLMMPYIILRMYHDVVPNVG